MLRVDLRITSGASRRISFGSFCGNLGLDLWKCVIYCDVSVCFVIYSSKIKSAEVSLAFLGGL